MSFARRALGGLVSQGVSSATNFLIVVAVARGTSAEEFGSFGLAMTLGLVAMSLGRALVGEPLLVWDFSDPRARSHAEQQALGVAAQLGFATAAGFALAGLLAKGSTEAVLLVFAAFVPVIFLQDLARYAFFGRARPLGAGALDVVWLVVVFIFLGATGFRPSAPLGMAAWGTGAAVSALVAVCWLRATPLVPRPWQWVSMTRGLGVPYVGEFLVSSGASQLAVAALGVVATLNAVGAVKAVQTAFGPVGVIFTGGFVAVVPAAKAALTGPYPVPRPRRLLVGVSVAAGAFVGIWTLLLAGIPDSVGVRLFGDTWAAGRGLIGWTGLMYIANGASMGAIIGLRSLGAAVESFRVRVMALPLVVVLPLGGGAFDGARGFTILGIVGRLLLAVLWWRTGLKFIGPDSARRSKSVGVRAPVGEDPMEDPLL